MIDELDVDGGARIVRQYLASAVVAQLLLCLWLHLRTHDVLTNMMVEHCFQACVGAWVGTSMVACLLVLAATSSSTSSSAGTEPNSP